MGLTAITNIDRFSVSDGEFGKRKQLQCMYLGIGSNHPKSFYYCEKTLS